MKLKVLSYNIHKGVSGTSKKFVLEEIREQIRKLDPDLVFLQEVLGEHYHHKKYISESMHASQLEYLADEVWPHHAYGKNRTYSHGHLGNAFLSKYPIRSISNLDISTNRFEKRGVLHITVDWPGCSHPLHCVCVHLNMMGRGKKFQLKQLCQKVIDEVPLDEPVIIAGDFNDWRIAASKVLAIKLGVYEAFKKNLGRHAKTFPARTPVFRLDRIYLRGFEVKELSVLNRGAWKHLSDHAALFASLDLESD